MMQSIYLKSVSVVAKRAIKPWRVNAVLCSLLLGLVSIPAMAGNFYAQCKFELDYSVVALDEAAVNHQLGDARVSPLKSKGSIVSHSESSAADAKAKVEETATSCFNAYVTHLNKESNRREGSPIYSTNELRFEDAAGVCTDVGIHSSTGGLFSDGPYDPYFDLFAWPSLYVERDKIAILSLSSEDCPTIDKVKWFVF